MENTFKQIESLYSRKAREYKGETNPFRNFNRAAALRGITRAQALDFFRLKHEVSILEMLEDDKTYSEEIIMEKFNDYITYTILLYAMKENRQDIPGFIAYIKPYIPNLDRSESDYKRLKYPAEFIFRAYAEEHITGFKYNFSYTVIIAALIALKNDLLNNRSK